MPESTMVMPDLPLRPSPSVRPDLVVKPKPRVDTYDFTQAPTGMRFADQPGGGMTPGAEIKPFVQPYRPGRPQPLRPGQRRRYQAALGSYNNAYRNYQEAYTKWKNNGALGPPPIEPTRPVRPVNPSLQPQFRGGMGPAFGRAGMGMGGGMVGEGQSRQLLEQIVGYLRRGTRLNPAELRDYNQIHQQYQDLGNPYKMQGHGWSDGTPEQAAERWAGPMGLQPQGGGAWWR